MSCSHRRFMHNARMSLRPFASVSLSELRLVLGITAVSMTIACATKQGDAQDIYASPVTARLRGELPTIFVAGDSTAAKSSNADQEGWGEPFAAYFDATKIKIANRARGGRSSRTFITEGHWDRLLAEMKAGDIVLIQFGHNDSGALNEEPPGSPHPLRARGSIQSLGEETQEIDNVVTKRHEIVHSFGWYVRKMIADARARGAIPVVTSLTVRNEWQGGRVERELGRYRQWDAEIAKGANVPFLDLTAIIAARYEAAGQEAIRPLFPKDSTHTNPAGADLNAECVVSGLKGILGNSLMPYLSARGRSVRIARTR